MIHGRRSDGLARQPPKLFHQARQHVEDAIDFGIWKQVKPSELVIPLDTHVMRISRWLGLTKRNTIGWATAEEVTASLRKLDPADPVRYDFALCHYGMSGACPAKPVRTNCVKCPLRGECSVGRKLKR